MTRQETVLTAIQDDLVGCRACPRLVAHREDFVGRRAKPSADGTY